MPELPLPRSAPERVADPTGATPLQALAAAYADRLAAIGSGAGDAELAGSELRIHELEQACRITYRAAGRAVVPDSALFLG
jgi:hypothetical protein